MTSQEMPFHPLIDTPLEVVFDTQASLQLEETVKRWLWTGGTGGYIIGPARIGKSFAVRRLVDRLRNRQQRRVPVIYTSINRRDIKTIRGVFNNLCLSVNVPVSKSDSSDVLAARFVQHALDLVSLYQTYQIVLIVDEMQRLSLDQLYAFSEIFDAFETARIRLMSVFVGNQNESNQLLDQIHQSTNDHIYGRFFRQHTSFYGVQSESALREILTQYDSCTYPDNGPSFTAYFLPRAVEQGWRFVNMASDIWRVYCDQFCQEEESQLTMEICRATLDILLMDFLPRLTVVHDYDDALITEAFYVAGI